MNRYYTISLVALLVIVVAFPIYAALEPVRMRAAQTGLQAQFAVDGAHLYLDNCAVCHGASGMGIGAMPALNNPGLAEADRAVLYDVVAHSPHGSAMASWHLDDGGSLNSYQVESLITLIMYGDWQQVEALATVQGYEQPAPGVPEKELATMEGVSEDPHECRACHEEPEVHAERFGLNCSRCHTLQAWKPALLTRHTFFLDHGGEGRVACQTCHVETYSAYTCYGCHDHQVAGMQAAHVAEGIVELEPCAPCHPTGMQNEAASLGYGLSGQSGVAPASPLTDQVLGDDIPSFDGPQSPSTPPGAGHGR